MLIFYGNLQHVTEAVHKTEGSGFTGGEGVEKLEW